MTPPTWFYPAWMRKQRNNFTPPWFMAPLVWIGYLIGLLGLIVACLIILGCALLDSILAGVDAALGGDR